MCACMHGPRSLPDACCRVLLLECVKQLDDAFTLMEVLREQGVPLLQVHGLAGPARLLGPAAAARLMVPASRTCMQPGRRAPAISDALLAQTCLPACLPAHHQVLYVSKEGVDSEELHRCLPLPPPAQAAVPLAPQPPAAPSASSAGCCRPRRPPRSSCPSSGTASAGWRSASPSGRPTKRGC
jgi:hypothetical protein